MRATGATRYPTAEVPPVAHLTPAEVLPGRAAVGPEYILSRLQPPSPWSLMPASCGPSRLCPFVKDSVEALSVETSAGDAAASDVAAEAVKLHAEREAYEEELHALRR